MRSTTHIWMVLLLVTSSVGYSAAVAEEGRDALTETVNAQQLEANRKICKRVRPTGSHIKQRVCLKRAEWDAIEEETQHTLREMNNTTRTLRGEPSSQ